MKFFTTFRKKNKNVVNSFTYTKSCYITTDSCKLISKTLFFIAQQQLLSKWPYIQAIFTDTSPFKAFIWRTGFLPVDYFYDFYIFRAKFTDGVFATSVFWQKTWWVVIKYCFDLKKSAILNSYNKIRQKILL